MKKLALRNVETGELAHTQQKKADCYNYTLFYKYEDDHKEAPGVALWDPANQDNLMKTASLYANPENFEIVEVEVTPPKVTSVVKNLVEALREAKEN